MNESLNVDFFCQCFDMSLGERQVDHHVICKYRPEVPGGG